MSAAGTALNDLLLAQVFSAVAGVDINLLGVDFKPFAGLGTWATDLQNQASTAINNANAATAAAATAQSTANTAQTTANSAMAVATGKPSLSQVPINSSLWSSLGSGEDSTFPRANLSFGSASSTSSGGDSSGGSHTHPMSSVPQYQPAGNGADTIEIGYIRASRDRTYTNVGFITGGSATFAGISGAYLGVYYVNPSTGALTLLNTGTATTDLSSSITTTNTQQTFAMGYTINANQGDTFAVALLQVTSLLQTCASLMDTTLTTLGASNSSVIPQANYCYVASQTSMPATIAASSLNYSASTKLPFYFLS